MRDKRAIVLKNPKLQKIRNNLRDLLLKAVSVKWNALFDDMNRLRFDSNGIRRTIDDFSEEEVKYFRRLQKEQAKLKDIQRRSILMCISCGVSDRDMVYNKSYDGWYCTECYDMHREHAKFLFQTIGKTKPYGHEDTTMHELLETFVDYEVSHEIELKLVREGILIYLLRFRYPKDDYATLEEIQKVLDRNQKAVRHVLKSLNKEKLVELEDTPNSLKVWLTQHRGTIEAERTLRTIRSDSFDHTFPTDLEDFKLLIGHRSDMIEYENPDLYEQLANSLKSKKVPKEEIKRKIEEHKKHFENILEGGLK